MILKEGSSLCGILRDKEAGCVPDTERRLCSWIEGKEHCTMCLETGTVAGPNGIFKSSSGFVSYFYFHVRAFEWRMRLGFIGKYAKTVFRVEGARMDRMRTLDS